MQLCLPSLVGCARLAVTFHSEWVGNSSEVRHGYIQPLDGLQGVHEDISEDTWVALAA